MIVKLSIKPSVKNYAGILITSEWQAAIRLLISVLMFLAMKHNAQVFSLVSVEC